MANSLYIKLEHTFTLTSLVLVNGSTNTGYTALRDGTALGAVVATPMFSRTIDSFGVKVSGETREAREQQLSILVTGTTLSDLKTKLDALNTMSVQINRKGGGTLYYRSDNGTAVTKFKVSAMKVSPVDNLSDYETLLRVRVVIGLIVDPFGLKPSYDITDDFSVDTFGTAGKFNIGGADWTADAGALTNGTVTGGVLDAAANLATENRFLHTGTGYTWGDVEVQVKHTVGATLTNYKAGGVHTRVDASNYINAYVDDTGAASRLRIDKVIAGVTTNLASTALTRITVSTAYWVVARIENNTFYAEHWLVEPTPQGTPTSTATWVMTTAEAAVFGTAIKGGVGVVWTPIETTASLDDIRIRAMVYRSWSLPDLLPMNHNYGGTIEARAGVSYTAGTTIPTWMLYSWWPKQAVHNWVWNGGAENFTSSATTAARGWVATAVAGVIGAGTSILRDTTSTKIRTGSAGFEIIVPATSDTGASFLIYRRFKKGITYTAQCYLKALAGTTNVRIKLGVSGDISTESAVALSATWTLHTIAWTPTADVEGAYVAIGVSAATATTFQMDDAIVYEGTTAPTFTYGGFGFGIHYARDLDSAKYNESSDGAFFATLTADATYLSGYELSGTGAMTTQANLEYFILQHLLTPDDFASGEVDVSIIARCEVASTQTSLNCVASIAPEGGTTFGARKYTEFRTTGKAFTLPSGGTVFRNYYLGTVTINVDRINPSRLKLRLAFTNSGAATGLFGVDFIALVPSHRTALSRSSTTTTNALSFLGALLETKKVNYDLSSTSRNDASYVSNAPIKDDGIGGVKILTPNEACEMLVIPSDTITDLQDSSTASNTKSYTGAVQVSVDPQVHLLNQ